VQTAMLDPVDGWLAGWLLLQCKDDINLLMAWRRRTTTLAAVACVS